MFVKKDADYSLGSLEGRVTRQGYAIMKALEDEYAAQQMTPGRERDQLITNACGVYESLRHNAEPRTRDFAQAQLERLANGTAPPPGYKPDIGKPGWKILFLPSAFSRGDSVSFYHGDILVADSRLNQSPANYSPEMCRSSRAAITRAFSTAGFSIGITIPTYDADLQAFYDTHPNLDEPFELMFIERVPRKQDWKILKEACSTVRVDLVRDYVFNPEIASYYNEAVNTLEAEAIANGAVHWSRRGAAARLNDLLVEQGIWWTLIEPGKRLWDNYQQRQT